MIHILMFPLNSVSGTGVPHIVHFQILQMSDLTTNLLIPSVPSTVETLFQNNFMSVLVSTYRTDTDENIIPSIWLIDSVSDVSGVETFINNRPGTSVCSG